MRLHRFFINEPIGSKKELAVFDAELLHQWKNVFRLRTGEHVLLLDNSGDEFLAAVNFLSKEKADLEILESRPAANVPEREFWLLAALIKKDNFEWIVEKGTEIGVTHFVPVVSERSEKKDLNMERAQKIIKEASEQSGRGMLPKIFEPLNLEDTISLAQERGVKLCAFHTSGESFGHTTADAMKKEATPTGIMIGPEGGWSDGEVELFRARKIPVYCLGVKILRAETAAIVASSLFAM